VPTFVERT